MACWLNEQLEHPEGAVFQHACRLEGIVSKRLGSRYRSGRSPDWLKFKNPEAFAGLIFCSKRLARGRMANFVFEGPKWGSTGLGTAGGIVTWQSTLRSPPTF